MFCIGRRRVMAELYEVGEERERVILAAVSVDDTDDTKESLEELEELEN